MKDTKALMRKALRHFTSAQLEKKLNCTQATISRWKCGIMEMPYNRGKRLEGIVDRMVARKRKKRTK